MSDKNLKAFSCYWGCGLKFLQDSINFVCCSLRPLRTDECKQNLNFSGKTHALPPTCLPSEYLMLSDIIVHKKRPTGFFHYVCMMEPIRQQRPRNEATKSPCIRMYSYLDLALIWGVCDFTNPLRVTGSNSY